MRAKPITCLLHDKNATSWSNAADNVAAGCDVLALDAFAVPRLRQLNSALAPFVLAELANAAVAFLFYPADGAAASVGGGV